ncbi:AfsR/SARP family transcriptional regulator [Paenibacillus thalictri]|nr:BTAD domain-containing putative transcriptional regulator [Paenibacillus thalictri]
MILSWLQAGRIAEAVMRLENEILQGREVDGAILRMLTPSHLQSSPLLLKARGQCEYKLGNLNEAGRHMASAVKLLARQSFRKPLLSAMAVWADILLRTGELNSAETLIQFLLNEYTSTSEPDVEGDVPYVISRGSRLLNDSVDATKLLLEAFRLFARDNRQEQADVALELLLMEHINPALEVSLHIHLQKLVSLDTRYAGYLHFAEAIGLMKEGQWKAAADMLHTVPQKLHSYYWMAVAELRLVQAQLRAQGAAAAEQIGVALCRIEQTCAADWELHYAIKLVKYEAYLAAGNSEEVDRVLREAEAIADMLKLHHPSAKERTGMLQPADFPDHPRLNQAGAAAADEIRPAAARWKVHFFGGLKITSQGTELTGIGWKRKKAKELFIYLLLQPNYSANKEEAAEQLFQQRDPDRTFKHLYVIVHQLRKALQATILTEDGVIIKDEQIRLNESVIEFVDVEQYISLLKIADQLWMQERALALEFYTKAYAQYDKLLPEYPYLDWVEKQREFLLGKQLYVLQRLGSTAEQQKEHEQAELYYREWLELAPYHEEAYQAMIRLLIATGRDHEAERCYNQLAVMCREQLNARPTEETRRLLFR